MFTNTLNHCVIINKWFQSTWPTLSLYVGNTSGGFAVGNGNVWISPGQSDPNGEGRSNINVRWNCCLNNWTVYNFYVTFYGNAFKISFLIDLRTTSGSMSLVTLKIVTRQNERCVACAPGQTRSRGLESFRVTP